MKKVMVTGANGFVGNALCTELSKQGIRVIAIVRNEQENIDILKQLLNVKIVYCDMSGFNKLNELIEDREIEVLYHLAWAGSAGVLRGDIDVQLNNVKYTCDIVKVSAVLGIERFIFASSIMEYEVAALMQTDGVPEINTLYSDAKVAADYMARTLAANLGVKYIRAVISNIYGPGEVSPRLINTSLRKLLNGEHCSFSSGEQMYDFIYIEDAAKTFIAIGKSGKANRTYYIGSQKPRPLKEFLLEMKNQINPELEIGLGELPFHGISLSYNEFDIHAVKNDTGFVPSVSFAQGIRNTIQWLKGAG